MMPNHINIGHVLNAARSNFLPANAKAFVGYIQAIVGHITKRHPIPEDYYVIDARRMAIISDEPEHPRMDSSDVQP
jgi:hypothetical protein